MEEARASNDGSVPPDLQVAILDLLQTCKEEEIDIPDKLGNAFMGALSSSRKDTAADIVRFEDRLLEDKEEHKRAISDSPIVAKAMEMLQKVNNPQTHPISLQIQNGSFKCIETIDIDIDDINQPPKQRRRSTQQIDTVCPCSLQRMIRCMRTGDFSNGKKVVERFPIQNVNLVFEQGKTYLVLGGPGSGKSSLLKMIAGILPSDRHHSVSGIVTVNNQLTPNTQDVVWSNIVGYIDQIDRLHPYLTVKETCDFAWQCRSGGTHKTSDRTSPEEAEQIQKLDNEEYFVTTVLESMGLKGVQDTFVGDQDTVRGISGGERKRVTVSEMAVGRFPIESMDEISTGLDAATTYDICKLLREVNALTKYIKVVTLLQPPPETFALFDDLILLSEGKVIYSGPVEQVVPYFESLGYNLPDRMDAADWLQTLPTKDGAQYLDSPKLHLTSDDFHAKFYASERGKEILEKLNSESQPNQSEQSKDNTNHSNEAVRALYKKRYRNGHFASLRLLTQRECMLWWRDKASIKARIIQDLVMGIIAGTVFWQGADEVSSVLGILFQSMLFISLGAMQKVASQYPVRGVLYKHQDANFFPTWTFVVGRSIASIPAAVIDGLLYGTIVFWFVGLAHNDGATFGNYIVFILIVTCASIGTGLLFSIFSSVTKDRSTGQACMSIAMVLFIIFSGFTVTPNNIPPYWIWLYWINIFAWAFRGLVVNEYASGKYDQESPYVDPILGTNMTYGELILRNTGFSMSNGEVYTHDWAGYSVLFSLAVCFIAVIMSTVALNKVRFETGKSLGNATTEIEEDEDQKVGVAENTLAFQKVNLTFKDIHYTVPSSIGNEKIEILKGIDGVVEAGKMTALMGSSGAGKTTLMDVLALRKSSGEISGEVRLNGHLQEEQSFRRCTGYVEQFDTQSAQLTIRETCEFSAKLRLDSTDPAVTEESTKRFVEQTLDMLELTAIEDLLVGSDDTGGLSLEQKKRLSIAVELVANPSIIFLDEPTSGLDARAAAIVMRGLKRIALTGRAICATIHQPSVAIFNSFDALLLMKGGGEVVFHGDLGNESSLLIEYLQSYNATPLIQPGENPATWMLTTIGAGNLAKSRPQFDYATAYNNSELRQQCIDKIRRLESATSEDGLISFPTMYATTWKTQCIEVMKRTWTIFWRSPSYNRTRIIVAAVLSLLIGSVFISEPVPQDETQMRSRMTTIYLSFLVVAVSSMITVLPFFEAERNMFYRHKSALMYSTRSVSIAFAVAECPFLIGTSLLYTTIFYFLLGFERDVVKFSYYYLFMLACGSIFTYTGQMLVALCRNAQIAHGFSSLLAANTGLFAGVLIQPQNIPKFWIFMYWLLPGHYILEGLLTTQFDGNTSPIDASPGSGFYQFLVSTERCGRGTECYGTAEEWIEYTFGGEFSVDNVPYDITYCVVVCGSIRITTLWALDHFNYRKT